MTKTSPHNTEGSSDAHWHNCDRIKPMCAQNHAHMYSQLCFALLTGNNKEVECLERLSTLDVVVRSRNCCCTAVGSESPFRPNRWPRYPCISTPHTLPLRGSCLERIFEHLVGYPSVYCHELSTPCSCTYLGSPASPIQTT